MTWKAELEPLGPGTLALELRGEAGGSWRVLIRALKTDPTCREALSAAIASAPFRGLLWETPAVSAATLDAPFRAVLLDCPALLRPQDLLPFQQYLQGPGPAARAFDNLGGDARLIAPAPTAGTDCAHLAVFLRTAPEASRHALWAVTAAALERRLADPAPVWVSTSGLGVSWVHVRLDRRPKYYHHRPFRRPPGG